MPRKPRSKSPTGYFHVTLRGNGGQLLFDDAEDRIAMLQILDAILPKHNIELIAWCPRETIFIWHGNRAECRRMRSDGTQIRPQATSQ